MHAVVDFMLVFEILTSALRFTTSKFTDCNHTYKNTYKNK